MNEENQYRIDRYKTDRHEKHAIIQLRKRTT